MLWIQLRTPTNRIYEKTHEHTRAEPENPACHAMEIVAFQVESEDSIMASKIYDDRYYVQSSVWELLNDRTSQRSFSSLSFSLFSKLYEDACFDKRDMIEILRMTHKYVGEDRRPSLKQY